MLAGMRRGNLVSNSILAFPILPLHRRCPFSSWKTPSELFPFIYPLSSVIATCILFSHKFSAIWHSSAFNSTLFLSSRFWRQLEINLLTHAVTLRILSSKPNLSNNSVISWRFGFKILWLTRHSAFFERSVSFFSSGSKYWCFVSFPHRPLPNVLKEPWWAKQQLLFNLRIFNLLGWASTWKADQQYFQSLTAVSERNLNIFSGFL